MTSPKSVLVATRNTLQRRSLEIDADLEQRERWLSNEAYSFPFRCSPRKRLPINHRLVTLIAAPQYQYSTQQMNQDLMVDGYIASTFNPQDAEIYHCILLRRGPHFLQPSIHNGIFYAMPPHRPDLDPRQPQTPWVIDHMVWNRGTVIGQPIWATRNQYELLSPPIFFVHRNGALGLPLIQAAGGDCMSLQGASRPAPLGETCSTHAQIRIGGSLTAQVIPSSILGP
ncbi:hypothetical protein H4582DRAFT_2059619 [Lactarius indigo]|nr:hypothetical protein H4582DRAFT_2059619 [Lactarius indigo]